MINTLDAQLLSQFNRLPNRVPPGPDEILGHKNQNTGFVRTLVTAAGPLNSKMDAQILTGLMFLDGTHRLVNSSPLPESTQTTSGSFAEFMLPVVLLVLGATLAGGVVSMLIPDQNHSSSRKDGDNK